MSLLLSVPVIATTTTFNSVLTNRSIKAEFTSAPLSPLDGPKIGYGFPTAANDTSFDW